MEGPSVEDFQERVVGLRATHTRASQQLLEYVGVPCALGLGFWFSVFGACASLR
jgi:hypothetical protein